jgi:hypothetical protein
MQTTTLAAIKIDAPELIKMTPPSTPAESQSLSKLPRRNAITGFMLTEPLNSSPIPFDKDNYSTLFGKMTCATPFIPVVPDANLNRLNFPLKRSLEKHHLENEYDGEGNCNESDLRLTVADALVESSHLEGVSLPQPKKCRVSLRDPKSFSCRFQVEKGN